MRPAFLFACVMLSIAAVMSVAQEKDSSDENVKNSISRALSASYRPFDSVRFHLYDGDHLSIAIKEIADAAVIEFTPNRIEGLPKFIISTTLPDLELFSPAYENVGIGPRNSLNIDLVTGKYYWEW